MFIFNSSIGKKFIQAVSGAFLVVFLLLHATINFFSVIDSFTGKYGVAAADADLFTKGDGLFKLGCDFMSTPVISIMVPVLALGFLVHIGYGIWLSVQNVRARGGVKRYEVASKAATDSWSARNMLVLGLLVLGFLFYHLSHFWAKMQRPEMFGFCVVFLHLTHGFWSMFQTVGWNGKTWFKRVKVIGVIVAALICFMFVATALNAFLQAHGLIPA